MSTAALPSEIHFDCPKCKRPMCGDPKLLAATITCPDCSITFIPQPRRQETARKESTISDGGDDAVSRRVIGIRRNARLFTIVGAVSGILGLLSLLFGLNAWKSGDSAGGFFTFCGWAALVGLGFYMAAQIVHIRANTEK